MSQIIRHTWVTSGRQRRCMECFEWIGSTSLQFRLRGEGCDREYCLRCAKESQATQPLVLVRQGGGR
jgi:hypothetical protein